MKDMINSSILGLGLFILWGLINNVQANYIELEQGFNTIEQQMGITFEIQNVGTIIMRSMEVLLLITGLWMFICIVWSGIEWQFARGKQAELDKSKTRLTNCVLGLTVVCLAYAVIIVVQAFFGLDGLFPNPAPVT